MTKLQEIVKELTETAKQEIIEQTKDIKSLLEFLDFQARFYQYSSRNQALIHSQRETAICCISFTEIKKQKLQLIKGSKAIKILAPCFVKELNQETGEIEKVFKRCKYVNTFDITQTNLDPEEYPAQYANKPINFELEFDLKIMKQAMDEIAKSLSIVQIAKDTADVLNGARGGYLPDHKIILLNAGNTESQNVNVLLHELGHAHMHRNEKKTKSKNMSLPVIETQAEMVAYIVSKYFGMDTNEHSFPYISGWSSNLQKLEEKEIPAIFQEVQNTAKFFITKIKSAQEEAE